ncbi:hypothetical protein J6590_051667 [Homalodisca vitripennis]|nr:hypothetical protein J6590_051667 [Homalodisca vitripennis]
MINFLHPKEGTEDRLRVGPTGQLWGDFRSSGTLTLAILLVYLTRWNSLLEQELYGPRYKPDEVLSPLSVNRDGTLFWNKSCMALGTNPTRYYHHCQSIEMELFTGTRVVWPSVQTRRGLTIPTSNYSAYYRDRFLAVQSAETDPNTVTVPRCAVCGD